MKKKHTVHKERLARLQSNVEQSLSEIREKDLLAIDDKIKGNDFSADIQYLQDGLK